MIQGKCCKHLIGSFVDLHKIFAAINPLQVSCGLVPMQHLMTLEHFVCLVRKELNEWPLNPETLLQQIQLEGLVCVCCWFGIDELSPEAP